MKEKDFEKQFIDFLINQKGYPKGSILTELPIVSSGGARLRPDLMVMDNSVGEYLFIVEFKGYINPKIKEAAKAQLDKYLSAVKVKHLPAYLVFPLNDNEFQILLLLENNEWVPVDKFEFPEYNSLSMKARIDEKIFHKEIEEKKVRELEIKKKKMRQSAYIALLSMIVGITVSYLSVVIDKGELFSSRTENAFCCDTLSAKIELIEKNIVLLENEQVKAGRVVDTIIEVNNSKTYKDLNRRVKIIESGISNNPEKTLSLIQVQYQIEDLKKNLKYIEEIETIKIESLNRRFDLLNSWMLAILITVFGAVLGFIFTNLRKENTTANIGS